MGTINQETRKPGNKVAGKRNPARERGITMRMIVLAAILALAIGSPAMAVTMADLLDNPTPTGSIIVGDKEIYGFHNYSSVGSGGATPVAPSTVFVQPSIFGSELGVKFQSANFFASPGGMQDTYFDFYVRILPGYQMLISDNTLQMTGSYAGTGRASIAEVVRTADELQSLANKLVVVDQYINQSVDHKVFPFPVPAIHVAKDIGVVGGLAGTAFVSDFSQTFSQTPTIPEPVTMAGLMMGIGGLVGYARKRRKA
jgi:hypothetical protein